MFERFCSASFTDFQMFLFVNMKQLNIYWMEEQHYILQSSSKRGLKSIIFLLIYIHWVGGHCSEDRCPDRCPLCPWSTWEAKGGFIIGRSIGLAAVVRLANEPRVVVLNLLAIQVRRGIPLKPFLIFLHIKVSLGAVFVLNIVRLKLERRWSWSPGGNVFAKQTEIWIFSKSNVDLFIYFKT